MDFVKYIVKVTTLIYSLQFNIIIVSAIEESKPNKKKVFGLLSSMAKRKDY